VTVVRFVDWGKMGGTRSAYGNFVRKLFERRKRKC